VSVENEPSGAKADARRRIERYRKRLLGLSHRIHANPELGFEEVRASGWVSEALADAGFAVTTGIAGLSTAFEARIGPGPLRLGICAEYDALPGLGHACGHNLIAAMAAGAAIALAEVADDLGFTVVVIGTPAEEFGNGKAVLLERGAFEGVHAAMMVHPAPVDVAEPPLLAFSQFDVRYTGREAHPSLLPEQGINALDALTVAQTALGLLRQHIRTTDRVHGIVTHGGDAPNVVPAHTAASYMVRARNVEELEEVYGKVVRCFEAGALATGSRMEIVQAHPPYADMRHDREIAALYRTNAEAIGRFFPDLGSLLDRGTGSSDMGNVSYAVPSIHPAIGVDSLPIGNHQPEFAELCAGAAADRAVIDGAVALAWTAIDVATSPSLRNRLLAGPR
jgi:amidohydrolase